jgi:predicted nucleic acid-binding Zn ribbon protein
VASVLDGLLQRLRLDERFAAAEATDRWEGTVGPEIARRTRCEGVRNGELVVSVRGATWMGDLAVRKHEILARLNEGLAEGAKLSAIRLTPMRGREEPGRDERTG